MGTAIAAGVVKSGKNHATRDEASAVSTTSETVSDTASGSEPSEAAEDEPEDEPEPETTPVPDDARESEETKDDTEDREEEPGQVPLEKYNELLKINPYVSGWLSVEGSKINDPVVYTPGSQNYFLHRDVDGTPLEKGTFFIAVNWHNGCNNTLVYGHNMKDGSGFGSLAKFADKNYGLSHSVINFDTLYEDREYELFAAFYSQIDEDELETEDDRADADKRIAEASIEKKREEGETVSEEELTVNDLDLHRDLGDEDIYREEKDEDNGRFRYYYYTDLSDRDDFEYFVNNVKERALYDTGVDAVWGDDLLTLSTCSYHVKNGRFIVVAVRHPDR